MPLEHRLTQKGQQWVFVCPISNVRSRSLFWVDETIGSREALGLKYYKERELERRLRRFQGVERTKMLRVETKILSAPPPTRPVSPGAARRQRSMSDAIYRGADDPTPASNLRRHALQAHSANLVRALNTPSPEASTETQTALYELAPLIDIWTLRERGLLVPGQFTHVQLHWDHRERVMTSLSIDLRKPKTPHLLIETIAQNAAGATVHLLQHVALHERESQTDRWRMICPDTKRQVKVLAFRFNRWASKEAQRLVYQSQRSDRFHYHTSSGYREMPPRPRKAKSAD